MRERKGDWRDLLSAHSLAVDAKKLWLGFVATLATVALIAVFAMVHFGKAPATALAQMGNFRGPENMLFRFMEGDSKSVLMAVLPLLNPFAAGWQHFAFSLLFYLLLMAVWSVCGGAITRLTSLQYARDDIPTLHDALEMIRSKRKAYYFAPVTPLFGIMIFAFCNMIAGLIGSIPFVGPWALAILLPFGVLPSTLILTFIIVLGVATFGLMFPAVSIGGKDAFEGW
ncbi:MAG: hypothetical protein KGZ25_07960, partial [Planctomycetes bacterium]|nr:hypothetical protein [Planctomycetota bacterium]